MVDLPGGLGAIYGLATGQAFGGWIALGVNLILSTLIGGIVLLIILEIISKAWNEPVKATNAFLVVLLINLINIFGIAGLLVSFVAFIPWIGLLLPLLIWIGLMKVFFGEMKAWHAVVLGIVGFLVSILIIPNLVAIAAGLVPI